MTELVRRDAESATTEESGPDPDTERVGDPPNPAESNTPDCAELDALDCTESNAPDRAESDTSAAAERVRARGRRVRRRELDTALARLREEGDLSREERRVVALLAARLADALVEEWAGKLADGEVEPETALALLIE